MKIGKLFNMLSKEEYYHIIDHYDDYSDFNSLGLYRSILENDGLDIEDKIEIRNYANQTFGKTFDFLQIKDPSTYYELTILGEELTIADTRRRWEIIRENQQKILKDKGIKHRNFGDYSKHNCGYDDCPYNGIMIKKGSSLAESHMHFKTDKDKYQVKKKAKKLSKQRRLNKKYNSQDFNLE